MSVHSLNTGAAMAIGGNVEIDRISASRRNLRGKFSRASAYAAVEPIVSAMTVETPATIRLLRSAFVNAAFEKIESKLSSDGWGGTRLALFRSAPVFRAVLISHQNGNRQKTMMSITPSQSRIRPPRERF